MRLAEEYDAAQDRGEIAKQGQRTDLIPEGKKVPTPQDVGLVPKDLHEARLHSFFGERLGRYG